jgi:hypothetical protein
LSDAAGDEVYGCCFRRLSWKVVMLLPSHDSMMLEVSRVDASTVSQQPAPFRVQLALAIALARARSASSRSRGEDDELNRWKKKVRGCEKLILFLCEEEVAGGVRTEGRKSDNYERPSTSLHRKWKSYEENLCDTCSADVLVQMKC